MDGALPQGFPGGQVEGLSVGILRSGEEALSIGYHLAASVHASLQSEGHRVGEGSAIHAKDSVEDRQDKPILDPTGWTVRGLVQIGLDHLLPIRQPKEQEFLLGREDDLIPTDNGGDGEGLAELQSPRDG
jgi:hypothetical protein